MDNSAVIPRGRVRMASTTSTVVAGNNHSKAGPSPGRFACFCTRWRLFQWLLFFVLVVGVAGITYFLVARQEEKEFDKAVRILLFWSL